MTSIANYLLAEGLDTTQYQIVDQCFKSFNKRRGYNELAITTEIGLDSRKVLSGNPAMDKCGVLVWFDRQTMKETGSLPDPTGMAHPAAMDLRLVAQALYLAKKSGALQHLSEHLKVDAEALLEALGPLFRVGS